MLTTDRIPVPMEDRSQADVDNIIYRMCNGHLLHDICEDNGAPLPSQIRAYAVTNAEFGKQFSRAVEVQAHMLFEEAVSTARNGKKEDVNVNRLKVDTLLKAAGKLLPKVYGDKADVSNVIPIQINMNLGSSTGVVGTREYVVKTETKEIDQ